VIWLLLAWASLSTAIAIAATICSIYYYIEANRWEKDLDDEWCRRLEVEGINKFLRDQMKAANVALNSRKYRDGV